MEHTLEYRGAMIKIERRTYGSRCQHHCWTMIVDGEVIGTAPNRQRAIDYAKATVDHRLHEAEHGKLTEDEIFARL